ncbi:hypothetical protein [Clostridium tetani]|uniref:hypothetical protein n=1 Tax=Clostridium tetani TaxID=1513 RepID=UPI000513F57F|nr:hypothetical protein [Clostridium tetani]KGI36862.1 hypothetical protein LA33_12085 [Clostridium tetani ATCC 9441]SUY82428.1 Uncharacterised protein [Clostridium tetani]
MNKGYEVVQLNTNEDFESADIICPDKVCPDGICSDLFCNIPIGICTCPPPPPDSGCPLAICGPEIAKNPGNR